MTRFPTTRWTLVHQATEESRTGTREQLGQLLERYWLPMFLHLRHKRVPTEKAEDLIQDFMLEIMDRELLSIADPKKGKLRTLLLTSLDRFAISQHRRETAAKRSPGKIASLDAVQSDETIAMDAGPGHTFDRAWGLDVLSQSLADMQRDCDERNEQVRWQVFDQRILSPLLDDITAPSFQVLAERLGLANEKTAMNRLITAKRQFARHLRESVRGYVRPRPVPAANEPSTVNAIPLDATKSANDRQVSYQLTEHAVRQEVEREIQELQAILGRSRSISISGEVPDDAIKADPLKFKFWQRLTRQHDKGNPTFAEMFGFGTTEPGGDEANLDVCFNDTLDTDLARLAGLEYDGPGTLRELLADGEAPLELFERVKDWINISRLGSDVTLPETVANGLYFVVLAVALVRGKQRITGLPDHDLRTGFQWAADQRWIDSDFQSLLNDAVDELNP